MSFTLRPYQREAVATALQHFHKSDINTDLRQPRYTPVARNGLIVLPTASGKSLVIADICHQLNAPVLILQPSKELLEQNYAKLESYGVTDIAIYSASKKTKEIAKFTYATIGSIIRRPDDFKHFRFVIIDEAHLVAPSGQYTKFLRSIGSPRVVGLTATPYRLVTQVRRRPDGKNWSTTSVALLTDRNQFFDKILYQRSVGDLVSQGFLAPTKYRMGELGQMGALRLNSTGTEFSELSLARYWSESAVVKLGMWLEDLPHARTLVFVPSLDMAHYLSKSLGVEMVSGDMPEKQREHVLGRFAAGKLHTLVNVGVLTTGYDLPELEAVVLCRPTMSLGLYTQMVGRVLRLDPARADKVGQIYDFAGNVGRFGQVERIQVVDGQVLAGNKPVTGQILSEVCVSDIMARRSAKKATAAI